MNFISLRSVASIAVVLLVAGCSAVDVVDGDRLAGSPVEAPRLKPVVERARSRPEPPEPPVRSGSGHALEALVWQALSWHPSISEAAAHVKESQQEIVEAKAGYLPGVSGGVRSSYSRAGERSFSPRFQLSAKQMLYDFGKVAGSVEAGEAGEALSHARLLASADRLARDTASAVVEIQRNRRLMEVAARQVASIAEIAKLVDQRTAEGASTDSDQVQAASRLESARAARLQYETSYQRELANLASLTSAEVAPSDSIPSWLPQACNVSEPDWNSVPDIQVAEAQHRRATAQLKRSRSDAFPTLSLEASTAYDLHGNDRKDDSKFDYTVGLNVSTPLYQGGATGARVRAAAFSLESADAARDGARTTASMQLSQARQQVTLLSQLQQTLNARTKIMTKARDLVRMQYLDLGTRTLLNVLDAEKELHDAELLAVNAEHDLRRLYVTCLYYSGKSRERYGISQSTLRPGLGEP